MSFGLALFCYAQPAATSGSAVASAHAATSAPAAASAAVSASAPATTSRDHDKAWVELAKALAWPAVTLLVAAGFRRPIADFVAAIGGRINKFSVFNVQVELTPAKASTTAPLLDDIRAVTNSAAIQDSSRMMLEQAQSTEPADYSLISLGIGDEWLTSRLFIAATMMERMRGVKVFVFVERAAAGEKQFVAVANVRQLRWALARQFPWLLLALLRAESSAYAGQDPLTSSWPLITTDNGAVEPFAARQLVGQFIASLQRPSAPPPIAGHGPNEWVELGGSEERASWVTRALLSTLLPDSAFASRAPAFANEPRARRSRALLRCHAPFVALVDEAGQFVRLVHRQAYLEDVAATLGEEPEGATR